MVSLLESKICYNTYSTASQWFLYNFQCRAIANEAWFSSRRNNQTMCHMKMSMCNIVTRNARCSFWVIYLKSSALLHPIVVPRVVHPTDKSTCHVQHFEFQGSEISCICKAKYLFGKAPNILSALVSLPLLLVLLALVKTWWEIDSRLEILPIVSLKNCSSCRQTIRAGLANLESWVYWLSLGREFCHDFCWE